MTQRYSTHGKSTPCHTSLFSENVLICKVGGVGRFGCAAATSYLGCTFFHPEGCIDSAIRVPAEIFVMWKWPWYPSGQALFRVEISLISPLVTIVTLLCLLTVTVGQWVCSITAPAGLRTGPFVMPCLYLLCVRRCKFMSKQHLRYLSTYLSTYRRQIKFLYLNTCLMNSTTVLLV